MPMGWAKTPRSSTTCASTAGSCGASRRSRARSSRSISGRATWNRWRAEERATMPYDPEQEPYVALRTKALESLLIEKGLLRAEAVDAEIARYEQDIGPLAGARVVARAWTDPAFRDRLLREGGRILPDVNLPAYDNL